MYGDHKEFVRSPKPTAVHIFLKYSSWNLLWTNHRDSSWFGTYFKLRTDPVHHTRVMRPTLCIGLHHLKSLKTLNLPTIYIIYETLMYCGFKSLRFQIDKYNTCTTGHTSNTYSEHIVTRA